MLVVFRCGDCGRNLKVSDQLAGKLARCPSCGGKTRIPGSTAPTAPAAKRPAAKKPDSKAPAGKAPARKTRAQPARKTTLASQPQAETQSSRPPQASDPEGVPTFFLVLIAVPLLLAPAGYFLGRGWLWGAVLGALFTVVAAVVVFWGTGKLPLRAGVIFGLSVLGVAILLFVPGTLSNFVWEPYTAPDQAFTAEFPGKPSLSTMVEAGLDVPGQKVAAEPGGTLFQVLFIDLTEPPDAPDQFLDQAEERIVSRGGKVARREDLPSRMGRELHLESSPRGDSRFQVFLAGSRFYQLEVTGRVAPDAVARFFKSFTLR